MSTLRSNLAISTIALVIVGAIRPGFNAVINRVFGPEVNGRAAGLIALIFLASLPATAGLPTVLVRHVSRALGAGDQARARGHARLGTGFAIILGLVGILGALGWGFARNDPPMSLLDAAFVASGVAGYTYWRLYRGLLLSAGKARLGLRADIVAAASLAVSLMIVVLCDAPDWAVGAFIAVYFIFALLTATAIAPLLARGELPEEERRSFWSYTLLYFVASGSSLAVKEVSILILKERVELAAVGEFSVALSLLMVLALAPRVLELPLIHELSAMAGQENRHRQKELTEKAFDWMTIIMVATGFGAALLAQPLLSFVGRVNTPIIALAFAIVALAFASEMVVTPATNLLVSDAHPRILAVIGAVSFLSALLWWVSPWSGGLINVVIGLAIGHLVRAAAISGYTRARYRLKLYPRPLAKSLSLIVGVGLVAAVNARGLHPFIAFAAFEALMLVLFASDIKEMLAAVLPGSRFLVRGPQP